MPHPVFTPTAVPPERLDEVTVGRVDLITRLVQRLRDIATSDARPHTLVVGPRGSGKTHLLSLVLYRARLDPSIDQRLAVAWIAEDALSIGSYEDLLFEMVRVLDASSADRARALRRTKDSRGLERLLLDIAHGRVLVLVLENLDRIFSTIGPPGQAALRGFVETASSVVLLASTPLLFSGVASRDQPWYGAFDVEHLDDLTLAEGTKLLRRVAREAGDDRLASYVGSSTGQARLRAVEHLAGGSPRLWHILAGCLTVETLDQLVPAVEALLDELAPYYQQRLWELPPSEQKIVVELGREMGARTVRDLADAVGMSERAAATALGRLTESRWVRGDKVAGTDRRTTWYELREPLLRHHLQYRDARGEPLRLIVEILQVWYSQQERRRYLAEVEPGSVAERHLVRTFLDGPPSRSDAAWADRDPDALLAEARCWIAGAAGASRLAGSPALGAGVESVVLAARGVPVPNRPVRDQTSEGIAPAVVAATTAAERAQGEVADRIGAGLRRLENGAWAQDDADLLILVSTCWEGWSDPASARRELTALVEHRRDLGRLTLAVRAEHAFWTGESGDAATARDLFATLVDHCRKALGETDPDTLVSRGHLAYYTGETGDPAGARDLFAALVAAATRVLGPDHEDTLRCRHGLAYWTGEAGDPAGARDLYATLVTDRTRVLGPDHEDTLHCRHQLASWTGEAGDPAGARDLYATLVTDRTRVLGPDHEDTLWTSFRWLQWAVRAGSGWATVAAKLGPPAFEQALDTLFVIEEVGLGTATRLLNELPDWDSRLRSAVAAALARSPRPKGWRREVLAAVLNRPGNTAAPSLALMLDALDGKIEAMASLPVELRQVVNTVLALDDEHHQDSVTES